MARYATSQRKSLLDFFKEHPHSSFSAKQIKDAIGNLGISISAVYRNLAILENDGLLQKVHHTGSKEVAYQYVGSENCSELIHLVCENCKKSYHFDHSFSDLVVNNAQQLAGFVVNKQKSFIYGLCSTCSIRNS